MCNQAQQEKGTFQGLKFINMSPLNNDLKERFSNLTVLNRHNEKTAKFAPTLPHFHFKRGGHPPLHFKNCSPGPEYFDHISLVAVI